METDWREIVELVANAERAAATLDAVKKIVSMNRINGEKMTVSALEALLEVNADA